MKEGKTNSSDGRESRFNKQLRELALLHLPEATPPLWLQPGQGLGRASQAGVEGPQSGQEMLHRLVLAPGLQLEWLLEMA